MFRKSENVLETVQYADFKNKLGGSCDHLAAFARWRDVSFAVCCQRQQRCASSSNSRNSKNRLSKSRRNLCCSRVQSNDAWKSWKRLQKSTNPLSTMLQESGVIPAASPLASSSQSLTITQDTKAAQDNTCYRTRITPAVAWSRFRKMKPSCKSQKAHLGEKVYFWKSIPYVIRCHEAKANERDPSGESCQTRKQQQTTVQTFRVKESQWR